MLGTLERTDDVEHTSRTAQQRWIGPRLVESQCSQAGA